MKTHNSTTSNKDSLCSFPHVAERSRRYWQTRIARIAAASMPGVGLAFCVRRLRERRFIKLHQLQGMLVRRDGEAVRVTGFQGRRVPYGVAFDDVRYEVDLLKGPGLDSDRGVPRGHHELLLGQAVQLASQLVNRPRRWAKTSALTLPRLYADFGDNPLPTPMVPKLRPLAIGRT